MRRGSSSVLEATIAGVVRLAAVWAALVGGGCGGSAARAGTTWDGGGIDTNFTTSANWDDDSAPTFTGGTSTLTFGSGGSTATVDTAADLARIILDRDAAFAIANGSGSLTLQGEDVGGIITGITAGPATAGTTVAYTISEQIALGATQSWNVANKVDGNGVGTTSLSVSGVVSGAGMNLTKLGSGTLALSGANTFTGSLTVAEGSLSINSWNDANANGPLGNSATPIVLGSATSSGTLVYTGAASNRPTTLRGIELAAGGGVIQIAGSGRGMYVHLSGSSISGSGPLTLDSPGMTRLLIVGSSTFSGLVTVEAGELQVNAASGSTVTVGGGSNSLGSAVTVDAGALLTLWGSQGSATYRLGSLSGSGTVRSENTGTQTLSVGGDNSSTAFSGLIQNSWDNKGFVALTKIGSGTLTLSGSNSYSGTTTISAGRLALSGNGVLGSGSYAAGIVNDGELVLGSDAAQTLSGVVSGTGSVTKSGAGTLTLGGANSFTGVVSVNAGAVSVASWNLSAANGVWGNQTNSSASPATTFIQMNGGRINYTGASASGNLRGVNLASGTNTVDVIAGATLNFSATNIFQSNGGNLVKEGAGTLQLGSASVANNIFTGKATINSGTLQWWGGGSMPAPATLVSDFLTINDGATLAMSFSTGASTVSSNIGFNLVGNATVLSSSTINTGHTIAGPIADGASAGSLIKTGAGRLTLTGSNSYTGSTRVASGTLRIGNAAAVSASTLDMLSTDTGSVVFAQASTLGGLTGSRDLANGGFTLSVGNNGSTTTYSGTLSGAGGLTKLGSGTLTLSGSNSYSGNTTISAGRLAVDGSILDSSGVSVASGAEFGGSGRVAAITGAGLVAPGNSPGILTAPSANFSGGLDFAFEFTQPGAPTWGSAPSSGNDVLRLTDGTSPLVGTATVGNVFDIYFAAAGETYLGGLFTDLSADFDSLLTDATFNYFVRDAAGEFSYGGFLYASLDAGDVTRSTVQVASATFGDGTVENGYAMQFVVVPEPGSVALAALGIGLAVGAARWRRCRA